MILDDNRWYCWGKKLIYIRLLIFNGFTVDCSSRLQAQETIDVFQFHMMYGTVLINILTSCPFWLQTFWQDNHKLFTCTVFSYIIKLKMLCNALCNFPPFVCDETVRKMKKMILCHGLARSIKSSKGSGYHPMVVSQGLREIAGGPTVHAILGRNS